MDRFELAKSLLLDFKKYVKWIHKIAQGSEYDMTEGHARLCDKLQEYAEGRNKKHTFLQAHGVPFQIHPLRVKVHRLRVKDGRRDRYAFLWRSYPR